MQPDCSVEGGGSAETRWTLPSRAGLRGIGLGKSSLMRQLRRIER